MSVSNPDSSRQNSNQPHQDPFDRLEFRLFRVVLFIMAVWAMLKFLNEHVPIVEAIRWVLHWLGY